MAANLGREKTFLPNGLAQMIGIGQGGNFAASGTCVLNGNPAEALTTSGQEGARLNVGDILIQVVALMFGGATTTWPSGAACSVTVTTVDITAKCSITAANTITVAGDADRTGAPIFVIYAKKRLF